MTKSCRQINLYQMNVYTSDMGRYPRSVRSARVKCIDCNAPAAETIDENYICVECGAQVLGRRESDTNGK